jgi:hypothetical protein
MRFPDLLVNSRDQKKYQRYRAERGIFIRNSVDFLIDAWTTAEAEDARSGQAAGATVLMQTRNVIEVLDGVEVLVREGCTQNCFHLLRSAGENYWGILWVLADDSLRRAKAYQLAHAHRTVAFAERCDPTADANRRLRERLADQEHAHVFEGADVDSLAIAHRMKRLFESDEFYDIEAAWQKAVTARGKKPGPPPWYSLFDGPDTTRQLAYRVGEGVAYETFYGFYSDAVHGTNAFDHMTTTTNGDAQTVRPIRHPFWINKVSGQAGQIALLVAAKVLKALSPDSVEAFKVRCAKTIAPTMRTLSGDETLDAPWA